MVEPSHPCLEVRQFTFISLKYCVLCAVSPPPTRFQIRVNLLTLASSAARSLEWKHHIYQCGCFYYPQNLRVFRKDLRSWDNLDVPSVLFRITVVLFKYQASSQSMAKLYDMLTTSALCFTFIIISFNFTELFQL